MTASTMYTSFVLRGMHSASEPWIDWGNYRMSYFLHSQGQGFDLQKDRMEGTTGMSVPRSARARLYGYGQRHRLLG